MKTLTIKNMGALLHRWLKKRAAAHHRSLNGEILHILQELADAETVGDSEASLGGASAISEAARPDVAALAGTWTAKQAAEFEKNIAGLRTIDEDMWR
jgi:plasmid stability protein